MNLDIFDDMNGRPKKTPWHERFEVIQKNFLSVEQLDWHKVFMDDPEILGNMINDMLKMSVPGKGRPGKRPALQREEAEQLFSKLTGENYSQESFATTFSALKELSGKSIRVLGEELGLDKMLVHRLLNGKQDPSLEQMEMIANHFNKPPAYFLEWRISYILTFIHELLTEYTESSIVLYKKVKK